MTAYTQGASGDRFRVSQSNHIRIRKPSPFHIQAHRNKTRPGWGVGVEVGESELEADRQTSEVRSFWDVSRDLLVP